MSQGSTRMFGNTRMFGAMRSSLAAIVSLSSCLVLSPAALAQIEFEDVTPTSGAVYTGESYGASWGDLNGDGWPDLFVNHHRATPSLYVNMGNGTFEDRWYEVDRWRAFPLLDQHGGAWSDFDADGDQDLFVSVGKRDQQQFLVNNGQVLADMTQPYKLDLVRWEGRLPVWFDFSQDGFLDFGVANNNLGLAQVYAQVPEQVPSATLIRQNAATAHQCIGNQYLQLADLNVDGALELICAGQDLFPNKVYDVGTLPFVDITGILPAVPLATDSVVGDFDGDLQTDMLIVRGVQRPSGAEITGADNDRIEANLITDNAREKGFSFVTGGNLSLSFSWNARNPYDVHIGASGYTLEGQPGGGPLVATLSAADPNNVGIQPHDPATDTGVYIGYEPSTQTWTVLLSPGGLWNTVYFFIDSTQAISNVVATGLQPGDLPIVPVLNLNQDGILTDQASGAGFGDPISCVSGAAGDFDNDMDLDLFLVCRGAVANDADRLYENQGGGTFVPVPSSGAEGPTGIGVGMGENVVVADYDVDGALDLFVTNGLSMFPEVAWTNGGPDKLFRNQGNGNHWVQLDLAGTTANADGVGAIVYATAGGLIQLREQNGGYHRWAQHHQRVHFGLGANATVDIQVHWPLPSTQVDVFAGVAADKLYRITEGGGIEEQLPPATVPPSPCVEPSYDKATESGVFVWKDCNAGTWHLRASPGGQPLTFQGNVLANQAFASVTAVSIEADDVLDYTTDPTRISYGLNVDGTGTDGFDFTSPAGTEACLSLNLPAGAPVYLGYLRAPVYQPFSLTTMGACADVRPTVSVADVTVAEDDPSGVAVLTVSLSAASAAIVSVDIQSIDGTATSPGDYTALPLTTLSFAPGVTSQVLTVPIHDDALAEGDEDFTLALSNATNGVVVDTTAKVTIVDDKPSPCGAPVYDKATEQGVFLWKDCAGGTWYARMTAGGSTVAYQGSVIAGQAFLAVAPFSIESDDILDGVSDPTSIAYRLNMGGTGQDGFDFSLPQGAAACFHLDSPAAGVYVGAARTQIVPPFDLATLGGCGATVPPSISVGDATAAEDNPGGLVFTVSLSQASASTVTVEVASVDGTATLPVDYMAPVPAVVTFDPGQTSQPVQVPIVDDALAEGAESFTLILTNPVNGVLADSSAAGTILDDEISPCGAPAYDKATEQGVFLWQDCPGGSWHARMPGGGGTLTYQGAVLADQPFLGVTGFSIEASDLLDYATDPAAIQYGLRVTGAAQDGFDFSVPAAAGVCFAVDAPSGIPVYVGVARALVGTPLSLQTIGPCPAQP